MKKLLLLALTGSTSLLWSQSQLFNTAGNHTFTPHTSVIEIAFEAIGAGGGGGRVHNGSGTNHKTAGGGGGGAYIRSYVNVIGGSPYNVVVGAGGYNTSSSSQVNGGDTYFATGSEAKAAGGPTKMGDGANNSPGAPGATATSCTIRNLTGTTATSIAYSGGSGGTGDDGCLTCSSKGGGGGGAAGSTGNGSNGGRTGGGAANSGSFFNGFINPGNGGSGRSGSGDGYSGSNYGGGGGGASAQGSTNRNGGTGGSGIAIITWSQINSLSASSGCPGDIITINGSNFVNVSSVTFNGVQATINSFTTTSIQVVVPTSTTGDIIITTQYGRAKATFTYNAAPNAPTSISGSTLICNSGSQTYTATTVSNAVSYIWTLPSGWTGTSTTNTINVNTNGNGGTISVVAVGVCGNSTATSLIINSGSAPSQPSAITGNTSVCNASSNVYATTNDPNAMSYTWTLPSGWSGSSTSNSISTTASNSSGSISVTANNACGSSIPQTINIAVANNIPATPTLASGASTLCNGASDNYSVVLDNSVTAYAWSLTGDLSGSSNSNSISITSGPNGGNAQVIATNVCGNSQPLNIPISGNDIPDISTATISGNINICASTNETYIVNNVTNATSFAWTLPSSWTGNSTTNSISTTTGNNGGIISVIPSNACGNASAISLNVSLLNPPSQPSVITGNAVICAANTQSYSVINDPSASNYTWTIPSTWSGNSNTNNITITPDQSSGTISVIASNACGSSSATSLSITVAGAVPAQPSLTNGNVNLCAGSSDNFEVNLDPLASYSWTLSGDLSGNSTTNSISITSGPNGGTAQVIATNVCGNSTAEIITINPTNIPDITNASISGNSSICANSNHSYQITNTINATNYIWSLPSGWSGTSTSNTIQITSGNTNGTISVIANNACGNSSAITLNVTITPLPNQPSAITGNTLVCSLSPQTFAVTNDPSVNSYTWTLPTSWSGTSSTNTITATPGSSGIITVIANGACGSSAPVSLAVSSPEIASNNIYQVACGSFTLNGETYNQSGTYNQVLSTNSGCDSNITIYLTILNSVNTMVTTSGGKMSAIESNAYYQWIDCATNTPILYATDQDFYPKNNGQYAVIVTKDGCSDTSDCVPMNKVSTEEFENTMQVVIYPNPTTDNAFITWTNAQNLESCTFTLSDITGKVIMQNQFKGDLNNFTYTIPTQELAAGIYIIQLNTNGTNLFIEKLIVKK